MFLKLVPNHHLTMTEQLFKFLDFSPRLVKANLLLFHPLKIKLSSIYRKNFKIQKVLPPEYLFSTQLYFIIYYASIFRPISLRRAQVLAPLYQPKKKTQSRGPTPDTDVKGNASASILKNTIPHSSKPTPAP